MTVSTVVNHEQYDGNGTTTVFPYRFRILKDSHMIVTVSDLDGVLSTLVLGTDYTITGVGLVNGGAVVLNTPLANGWQISLDRDLPAVQETDLRNQGRFFAETHEDALDYLTMLIQRLSSLFGLALRKPSWIAKYYDAQGNKISNLGDPASAQDAATKNYVDNLADNNFKRTLRVPESSVDLVPQLSARANRVLAFNNDGNPIAVVPGTGSASEVMIDLASSADGKGDALIAVKQPLTGSVSRTQHDKNLDQISVKDFGAKLDGATDDTAAFQAAAATGRPVFVPYTAAAIKLSSFVDGTFYSEKKMNFTGGGYANIITIGKQNFAAQFNLIKGKLNRGTAVKISCFGDSTTEGYGSSGWTARPTGSQAAYNPATAYPAQLQKMLRDINGSTNVTINNCGYGGQSLIDDWAYSNYKPAVTDLYGIPDAVIVAFGLNDVQKANFSYALYRDKLFTLIWLMLKDGTLPILQTCSPTALTVPANINNKNLLSDVFTAQKEVAAFFGLPLIDQNSEQTKWFNRNYDFAGNWLLVQPDNLHYTDAGYSFVASVVARELCPFIVSVDGITKIAPWQGKVLSRSGATIGTFNGSNNGVGGNLVFNTADAVSGDNVVEIWLWNSTPLSSIRYLGVGNDGVTTSDTTKHPNINMTAVSYGYVITQDVKLVNVGIAAGSEKNASENSQLLGQLPYGLVRLQYKINDAIGASGINVGYFSVTPGNLANTFKKSQFIMPGGATAFSVLDVPFDPNNDTRVNFGLNSVPNYIVLNGNWPQDTGIIICESDAYYFSGSTIATTYGPKGDTYRSGILLFRDSANKLSIMDVYWKGRTGEVYLGASAITASAVFTADGYTAFIGLYKNASGFNVDVRLNGTTTTLLKTFPYAAFAGATGGWCGSVFNGSAHATSVFSMHNIGFI